MHFFDTKDRPPLYAGIAAVALMILTGLTFTYTAVALAVMMPLFVVLSPILVPVVITSSVLAMGFLASGSLGASGIALLVWLFKKKEHSTSTLHARGVRRPEGANKLAEGDKWSGGDHPLEKDKPSDEDKLPGRDKPLKEDKLLAEEDKPAAEDKPLGGVKPAEEDKTPRKDESTEGDKPAAEDKPLGGFKYASIPEISQVLVVEQKSFVPKCSGPSTKRSHQFRFAMDANKARSIFMKEYQKAPRVGAFAYKYFTSRDKKYVNYIHI